MTEKEEIELREQLFSNIIGCAFRSYNFYHWGVDEIVYEAGVKEELQELGYEVFRQQEFPIFYKGRPTDVNRKLDLLVYDKKIGYVILELKSLDYVGDIQRKQLWSYMKLHHNKYGMLINFSPNGVYSEKWMLGNTYQDKCIRL